MRCDRPLSSAPSTLEACAREAIVFGAALITFVQPHDPASTHAAARMELLACCGRAGLMHLPEQPPVLAEFDRLLRGFARDHSHLRRAMVVTMDRLVGTAWAEAVLIAVARIGVVSAPLSAPGRMWLERMRAALALTPPAAEAAPRLKKLHRGR
jgi:hypothetical protein